VSGQVDVDVGGGAVTARDDVEPLLGATAGFAWRPICGEAARELNMATAKPAKTTTVVVAASAFMRRVRCPSPFRL
jgi:hypothetical protein